MDSLDNLNVPKYAYYSDLLNAHNDVNEVDKFFDIDHEAQELPNAPSVSLRETFDVVPSLNITSTSNMSSNDKENVTPKSVARKRDQHESSTEISGSEISTYMTPGTSKRKSQIAFMSNGRSLLVQSYDGISLVTPNKTHAMETRLDAVIKSPGLSLRSRSVHRDDYQEISTERTLSTRKSKRLQHEDIAESMQEDIPEKSSVEDNEPMIEKQETSEVSHNVHVPVVKTTRPAPPHYRAPMVALHPSEGPVKNHMNSDAVPKRAVKFMSAAEVVHHYLKDTPDRFHSKPAQQAFQNKMHIRKAADHHFGPRPNTIAKSPFLSTKFRQASRYTEHIPSQEEKEEQEIEEIKKYKIKANPVVRSVLIPRPRKDIIATKTPTRAQPFNLSKGKRKEPTPEPVFRFKAQPLPRGMLASPTGLPPRKELPLTEPHSPNLRITAKYPKRIKVETPGGNQPKEVGHFGIKDVVSRHCTKVQPFSFEKRDKELQQHKQELIQKTLEEERLAREFKAQKIPRFSSPALPQRKRCQSTTALTPQISAYSHGLQNQMKFQQQLAEEEARKREAAQFKARPAKVTQMKPFEPILPKRMLTDVTELQLKTERRAVDRARFDEKLKKVAAEMEEQKAELLALREAEAREEEARLRREAEFKATELRLSSPYKIMPSSKPLTQPQSPMLLVKERASRSFR